MEKKDAARTLYLEGYNQAEIAKVLRLNKGTVSNWCRLYKWKEKKINEQLMQDNSIQRVMYLIDYQSEALVNKVKRWKEEQKKDDAEIKFIDRGEIDALTKLFAAIRKDAKKFSDYVHVMKEFITWLHSVDPEASKSLIEHSDGFINEKRKVL